MNQLKPTVNIAKIQIPTGYEQLQREAATKRRLAEAMLSQGLAPQRMGNWTQVLGKFAQTWAGKSLDKEATEAEVGMQQAIRQDYLTARDALMADVRAGKSPDYIMQTHGSNPLLQEDLKPFAGAYAEQVKAPIEIDTARRKDENKLIDFNGLVGVRQGDVMGQPNNSPTSMVHQDAQGNTFLNPVAVTAAAIGQGNLAPVEGYATTGRMPGVSTVAQAMAGQSQPPQQTQPQAEERVMNFSDVQRFTQSMAPNGLQQLLSGVTVSVQSPQEADQLPPGTRLRFPDGSYGWAQ